MEYSGNSRYLGLLNDSEPVRRSLDLPRKVLVKDITLREGFGSGLFGIGVEEMTKIAEKLDEMNFPAIQIEFRGHSDDVKRNFKIIKEHVVKAKLDIINLCFSKDWKEILDAATEVGVDSVCYSLPCSELEKKNSLRSESEAFERIVEAVEYGRGIGLETHLHIMDAPRTDIAFIKKACRTAIDTKVDGVGISDTWGVASPAAWRYLVGEVKKVTLDKPFSIHCHNDFGQALANTLAGVEAGADNVDASINGYGERSGMPSLDEVVAALTMLYGMETGIKLDRMVELYRLFEELTGIPTATTKPLVGKYAFSYHYDSRFTAYHVDPLLILPFSPKVVGNEPTILFTRYSGPVVLEEKLRNLKLEVTTDRIPHLLERAKQQLLREKKPFLTDQDIKALVWQIS